MVVFTTASNAFAQGTPSNCTGCTASTMNPTAAAFAMEGYYEQDFIITQIEDTTFGLWAPLLYILAAFSGLILAAMGQPPKLYLWFILGPAIYNFVLLTTVPRSGVSWTIGSNAQDMKHVWKLGYAGMQNNPQFSAGGATYTKTGGPGTPAQVSYVFAFYDDLVSDTVRRLVDWTGIFTQQDGPGLPSSAGSSEDHKAWFLMSNLKWSLVEDITAVTANNPDVREALVVFMSGECGNVLTKHINKEAYVAAKNSRGGKLSEVDILPGGAAYTDLIKELGQVIIPMPGTMKALYKDIPQGAEVGKFMQFDSANFNPIASNGRLKASVMRSIKCDRFLWNVVQALRWEAGHAYHQLMAVATDHDIEPIHINRSILYGWEIPSVGDGQMTEDEQRRFIQNMIFFHLFKNEFQLAPNPIEDRSSPSAKAIEAAQTYLRELGGKQKFAELYNWAKLMPFVQGILMYVLAAAYPLACILIVVPGWWKALFTWSMFWAWAKSWDVGFAIVVSLERNIWSMLGSGDNAGGINDVIHGLGDINNIDVSCQSSTTGALDCGIPIVTTVAEQTNAQAVQVFETGLKLFGNLDFVGINNSYYIYLMSAFYFAVPVASGLIFKSAVGGASSLISGALSGVSQEAGKAAMQSAQKQKIVNASNAFESASQAAYAKSLRGGEGGALARASLASGNKALQHELAKGHIAESAKQGQFLADAKAANMADLKDTVDKFAYAMAPLSQLSAGIGIDGVGSSIASGGKALLSRGKSASGGGAAVAGIMSGTGASMLGGMTKGFKEMFNRAHWAQGMAAIGNRNNFVASARAQQMARLGNSAAGRAALGHGIMEDAQKMMGGRFRSAAEQQAKEDQWRARRALGNQYATRMGALGASPSLFSAGSKPVSVDGMAGRGDLNQFKSDSQGNVGFAANGDVSGSWGYGSSSQFAGHVQAAAQDLHRVGGQVGVSYTAGDHELWAVAKGDGTHRSDGNGLYPTYLGGFGEAITRTSDGSAPPAVGPMLKSTTERVGGMFGGAADSSFVENIGKFMKPKKP